MWHIAPPRVHGVNRSPRRLFCESGMLHESGEGDFCGRGLREERMKVRSPYPAYREGRTGGGKMRGAREKQSMSDFLLVEIKVANHFASSSEARSRNRET